LLDEFVHRLAGFDKHEDSARFVQRRDELRQGMSAGDRLARSAAIDEGVHFGGRAVVHGDGETMVGDVQGEVLAHDREADEADVRLCAHPNTGSTDTTPVAVAQSTKSKRVTPNSGVTR